MQPSITSALQSPGQEADLSNVEMSDSDQVLLRYPPLNMPLHELPIDCVPSDSFLPDSALSSATRQLVLNKQTEEKLEDIFDTLGIDDSLKERFIEMAKEDLFNKILELEAPEKVIPYQIEKTKYAVIAFCPSKIFYKDLDKPQIPLFSSMISRRKADQSQQDMFTKDDLIPSKPEAKVSTEAEQMVTRGRKADHYKAMNNERKYAVWVPIYQLIHEDFKLDTQTWLPFIKRAGPNADDVHFLVSPQHLKFVDVKFKDALFNLNLMGNDYLKEPFVKGLFDVSEFRNQHNLYAFDRS